MAKIFKFSGYAVDPNGEDMNTWDIENALSNLYFEPMLHHLHIEEAQAESDEEGTLVEDSPLWLENCDLAHCEKYFKEDPYKGVKTDRQVEVGSTYKHFKEGKLVKVLAVAQDTENVGSYGVVYECKDLENNTKIWIRPLEMFLSEVDREKYPNATQKYRFEKVED